MASDYTQKYHLPLWEAEDNFVRVEFNEMNQALETALAAKAEGADLKTVQADVAKKADASALNTLQQTVAAKADSAAVSALQTAVNGKAAASTVSALQTTVNQLKQAAAEERVVVGSYTGNCKELNSTAERTITLPFTPKLVILSGYYGNYNAQYDYLTFIFGDYCHWVMNSACGQTNNNIAIVTNGFKITGIQHNILGKEEHYVAIR